MMCEADKVMDIEKMSIDEIFKMLERRNYEKEIIEINGDELIEHLKSVENQKMMLPLYVLYEFKDGQSGWVQINSGYSLVRYDNCWLVRISIGSLDLFFKRYGIEKISSY